MTNYSKAIAAAIGAAATWATTYFPHAAWAGLIVAAASVALVVVAPKNRPGSNDRGESFAWFLQIVALCLFIVCAAVWLLARIG